jgi:hypothetical protein
MEVYVEQWGSPFGHFGSTSSSGAQDVHFTSIEDQPGALKDHLEGPGAHPEGLIALLGAWRLILSPEGLF